MGTLIKTAGGLPDNSHKMYCMVAICGSHRQG